jgi:acetyl-CoA acyltransferase
MKRAVIVGYARTPFHFANKGDLKGVRPDDLVTIAVKGLLAKTKIKINDIEDLLLGCAFPEGEQGLNVARLVVLLAGLPISVGGATINRFCGSSMQAIHTAVGAIACDAGDLFICGGIESMSRIPMGGFNPLPNPVLFESMPGAYMSMGETAENVVTRYGVSRKDQDEFAFESQKKATAARENGKLKDEIIPVQTRQGLVDQDGCIRPDTTLEGLAALKPAFVEGGSVTAGNSSPLTDGASATLICSEDYAKENHLEILAYIKSFAVAGCDPEIMGMGPVYATRKALQRADMSVSDLDIIELNEAFASQSIACINELGLDRKKINLDGGAIALGHPLGASGARLTGKAATLLKREKKKYALATMCIGGGQGIATILERIE